MRLLAPTLLLALAGCHAAPDPATVADQPNESVVEAQLENEQDAIDDEIVNDADENAAALDLD